MDPENTNPDTTAPVAATTEQPATQPAGQQANQGATFTAEQQEIVNRIVVKRLEEDRARRPVAAPPAPKPAQQNKSAEQPDLASEIAEMRRAQNELKQQLDYERRTKSLGLDETRAAALFSVYQANPDGFDATVSALGIKATNPAAPAATTATQPEAPRPQPAAAPSAPTSANLPTSNGIVDIFAPGVAKQLGPQGVRENLEKLWKIGEQQQGKPQRPTIPSQRK